MKKIIKCLLATMAVLTYTACGNNRASSEGTYSNSYSSGYSSNYEAGYASDSYYDEAADYDYAPALAESSYAGGQAKTANAVAEPNPTEGNGEEVQVLEPKLVYKASMRLETLEYENSVKAVREHIAKYNGIIEFENEYDNDNSWYYTDGRKRTSNRSISMTVRIPTENFDKFLTDMEGTAKVTSRSQNVENIARRYNDNSIAIEALEKQQDRLLEMMDKADTIEEMIMVEERLADVQTELNQKKSYRSTMDTDVDYSTIDLSLNEVQQYTPTDDSIQLGGYWKRLGETFVEAWKEFVYFLQNVSLFIVKILPFACLIAVIILLIKVYRKKKGLDTRLIRLPKRKSKSEVEKAKEELKENIGAPKE